MNAHRTGETAAGEVRGQHWERPRPSSSSSTKDREKATKLEKPQIHWPASLQGTGLLPQCPLRPPPNADDSVTSAPNTAARPVPWQVLDHGRKASWNFLELSRPCLSHLPGCSCHLLKGSVCDKKSCPLGCRAADRGPHSHTSQRLQGPWPSSREVPARKPMWFVTGSDQGTLKGTVEMLPPL